MIMNNPLITIVTVCFNAVDTIEKTIQSVLNQTYQNVEYIVIDGASTDGTQDMINKYRDKLAYYVSEPDGGIYDALNKGVKYAHGDWIGILNCGDLFHDTEVLSNIFLNPIKQDIGVVFGNSVEVEKKKKTIHISKMSSIFSKIPPDYRHGASFVRNSVHKKYLFDLDKQDKYNYGLDYLQIYTMFKNKVKFHYVDLLILDYQKEGMSNHPWKNKYLRVLTIHDGKKNLVFYKDFIICCVQAAARKIRWIR